MEYWRAVAAYAVAHGLAGVDLSGFGVPQARSRVGSVAIETDDAVDDVRVRFTSGWQATVQAKRTLRKDKVFTAAVRQWKAAAERGLDPSTERLVLVGGSVSGPLKKLAEVLRRLKTDEPGALTAGEEDALSALDEGLTGLDEKQREAVLRCAVIHELDVEEPERPGAREAVPCSPQLSGPSAALMPGRTSSPSRAASAGCGAGSRFGTGSPC